MPNLSVPITPQEAERVWKSQARPSARSVAEALTRASRAAAVEVALKGLIAA
jgi:hypothetical protein